MALSANPGSASPLTSGDETTSSVPSPRPMAAAKKRKSTYYARKDESKELSKVVKQLTGQLNKLKQRHARRQLPLHVSLTTNVVLQSCIKQTRCTIASTQSIVGSYASREDDLPPGGHVHMPRDTAQRQQVIENMKPQKIKDAVEYLLQRNQHVDLRRPCRQMENYTTEEGGQVGIHWEIACFDDESPAQVFADMLYFVRNQEMEMAEKLGSMSIRESDINSDAIDSTQVRMVSTHKGDITCEKNIVLYSQYFPASELLNQPHAVFTVDFVNEDEAFPYQHETRLRKDFVSAILILETPATKTGERPKVAMIRWAYMKMHNNPLLVTPLQLEELSRHGIMEYFDAMVRVIRERTAWRTIVGPIA